MLWASRSSEPNHGFPRAFVTFGEAPGGLAAQPEPYELPVWTVVRTQTGQVYVLTRFERASEPLPKEPMRVDPLCKPGRWAGPNLTSSLTS